MIAPSNRDVAPAQSAALAFTGEARATAYVSASLASSTKKAYASDLSHFLANGGAVPSSSEVIAQYLAIHGESLSPFTLARRLVSIGKAHEANGWENPTDSELVRSVLRGIRRVHGCEQRRVDPIVREDILAVADSTPNTVKGARDRALILVGFASAMRRSELVALNVADVRFVSEGMVLRLRRSKTDQEGTGRDIGIPFARSRACPVKALIAWMEQAQIIEGAIFRSVGKGERVHQSAMTGQSVALVVKHYANLVGLDSSRFSGHSLRAGLITSAAKQGASAWKIRAQSGHKSETMLSRYIRDGELFVGNAVGYVL